MPLRLAIFDFDGTLVDSFGWFVGVFNNVAARHGFRQVDEEEGKALRDLDARAILKRLGIPFWKLPAIARDLRAMKLDAASGLSLFAGIPEVFDQLHVRGIVLAIVSSDSEESIRRTLPPRTAALVSHFNCNASLFGKSRKLVQVVRAAGIARGEAIYIGDELRDATAAREAGLRFGAVTWGYATPEALEASAPDVMFRRVAEIGCLGR